MKLRNKRTGEIIEWEQPISSEVGKKYYSLTELSADWEDYEEPKEYWSVSCGAAIHYTWDGEKYDRATEAVGLKFDTKEECERAIEKMKAWKRLKDKGFKFRWIDMQTGEIKYSFFLKKWQKVTRGDEDDLMLLFRGEE